MQLTSSITQTKNFGESFRPATRYESNFIFGIKALVYTIGFGLFCVAAGIALWYTMSWFTNDSYKAAAFFMVIIAVSNVAGKYLRWCIVS